LSKSTNIHVKTVEGFGQEWSHFDQTEWDAGEHRALFDNYFGDFPFDELRDAQGFDLGCGSGRWAALIAPRVSKLHCIDAALQALEVARRRLAGVANVEFHLASVDQMPLPDESQDFGYSLGVLHHIPDTQGAMDACVRKLRKGAPFLVYLYYSFDNRPWWFKAVWKSSDLLRLGISRMPFAARRRITTAIAAMLYLPLARAARVLEQQGLNVEGFPLSAYRDRTFYAMKTDALDRFGTRLEQRFSKREIAEMMERSGLRDVVFNDWGNWIAWGRKA
jgi:ubiquinone/menaquinone biosynthesis C-methylase UbiE